MRSNCNLFCFHLQQILQNEKGDGKSKPTGIEYHRSKLHLFCRLCKQLILIKQGSSPIPVFQYQNELTTFHNLDVLNDDNNIYPVSLCNECVQRLETFKGYLKNNTAFVTNFVPATFLPHCDINCEICKCFVENSETTDISKDTSNEQSSSSTKRKLESKTEEPKEKITKPMSGVKVDSEVISIKADRFVETEVAGTLCCQICKHVPIKPTISLCGHIFCQTCIIQHGQSQINGNTCTKCGFIIKTVIAIPFEGSVFDVLHVKCKFVDKGCQETLLIKDLVPHEVNCKYGKYREALLRKPSTLKRGPSLNKTPLHEADRKYVRQKRLKPLMDYVTSFCEQKIESKIDVLYFLLYCELGTLNKSRKADAVYNIWQSDDCTAGIILSPEECLGLKVETLQNKTQYRTQYEFFNQRKDLRFCNPNQVNAVEKQYMPNNTSFEVLGDNLNECVKFKYSGDVEPLNILESFNLGDNGEPELPAPKCRGVRWFYVNAIAKTLDELDSEISASLEKIKLENEFEEGDLLLKTYIKDRADVIVDIVMGKAKGDSSVPDKKLRFSFCVLESVALIKGKKHILYKEENPNSVRRNRPLLEVLGDVNDKESVAMAISPLEKERDHLKGKILKVHISDSGKYRKHELNFISSVEDVQYFMSQEDEDDGGPSSIGALCMDGTEGGSKAFRRKKKNLAPLRTGRYRTLVEILKQHWLYSSPKLQKCVTITKKTHKCSNCSQEGHTCATCPESKTEKVTEAGHEEIVQTSF